MNGVVVWFDYERGFGFVRPSDGTRDVFVHASDVQRAGLDELLKDQRVSFDVACDRGKPRAVNLKRCPR